MSTSVNQSRTGGAPNGVAASRPRLTVVPRAASTSPRMPFLLLVVAVLAAGLVGLLLLNTSMERGAYEVTALRKDSATLAIEQQSLQLQVATLKDPQKVAEKALRLGMVSNPSPAFLSLATGEVVGRSAPGAAGSRPDIGTSIGPGGDRLGKVPPVVGGLANAGTDPVTHRAPRPRTGRQTLRGDTAPKSTGSPH